MSNAQLAELKDAVNRIFIQSSSAIQAVGRTACEGSTRRPVRPSARAPFSLSPLADVSTLRSLAAALAAALALAAPPPAPLHAQGTPRDTARSADRPATVTVFLDCNECDGDFVRTEMTYVNWVRDRTVADVHILVTTLSTGGGGREFTLALLGRRAFAGIGDTATFVASQGATPDEIRRGVTRAIARGLVPFLSRTGLVERLLITLAPPRPGTGADAGQVTRDRWNLWVYTLSASMFTNGEKQSSYLSVNGSASARRTTAAWKLNVAARQNYNESRFSLGDETSTFIRRSTTVSELAVKSLGPRLSAGLRSSFGASTFENKRFYGRITPAIEFDFYPYAEATRRTVTLQYAVGVETFRYMEETIFARLRETRPLHTLNLSVYQNQPWGSISGGADFSQFLDATDKNSASFYAGTSVRLFRGFNFNVSGSYEAINNQLYLPRRGATDQEILTQQRRLATNYSYYANVGFSYSFGSLLNNVVNPRFGRDGGGGGTFFF